jgi:hypothetical protein
MAATSRLARSRVADRNPRRVGYGRLTSLRYDCVFGSRFSRGGRVVDYPRPKLVLNRLGNWFIQLLFRISCNDISNAFKIYRRTVIAGSTQVGSRASRALDRFELVLDDGEVAARLVGLA